MNKRDYFAIFGGGGIRGLAYCGAYKALLENNINLTGYAGSSIGAVFATLLALKYNYDEIYEILSNTGFEMFIDLNLDLKKEIAVSKGNIFYDWIKEKIERKFYQENYKKGQNEPVTFFDIKENLIVYSVNLTTMKFMEFSKEKTPDFEVAKAVRASVSMPGLFTPLEYDNNLLVDGDLLKSTPLWRVSNFIKNLDERIIEFRLEDNSSEKKINNSLEYLNRVYNAISGFATDYIIDLYKEKDKFDYIKINTKDISVIDFLISKEKKKMLFETGYNETNSYFREFFPKKKDKINEKYKKLLNHLLKFQEYFNKNKLIDCYLNLCETFIFLCEEKKYLDLKIYDLISDFKNKFSENYYNKKFLIFQKSFLKNKEELSKDYLEILREVAGKIQI